MRIDDLRNAIALVVEEQKASPTMATTDLMVLLKRLKSEVLERWDSIAETGEYEEGAVVMNDAALRDEIADLAWDRVPGWREMSVSQWNAALDAVVSG